jgi:hypothetical protein
MADSGRDRLGIYLNDHLAGSTAGLDLARRAAGEHPGELGRFLSTLADEIAEDRATLEQLIERVGAEPDPLKVAVAWVAEKLGRLKPNGSLFGRSPLTPLIELEALVLGIHGKLALWRALRASEGPHAYDLDVDALIIRAERQEAAVEAFRLQAARDAFA